MAQHVLDIAAFRAMFPQFANPVIYPDDTITTWWTIATCAMESTDSCVISGDCLQTALYLMTAHIGLLMTRAAAGSGAVGAKLTAQIDKVSVGYAAPPYKDGWQYWLSQTPYGVQLWAILEAKGAGGFYIGGLPETAAIRKVCGVF